MNLIRYKGQNMVSNATQYPHPLPATLFYFGKGERWGRGTRGKVRGAILHKARSKIPP
jgi:hypothetical protein